ncbi:hypothetical protein [Pelodictyon luteolum]|uniref:hypothetical protein n=1 Tax=Pelodictyon luteolum TaxID=1100 RepID=UPI0002F66AA9|nr:hypothetical protein [Pelodictyon luteolum]
MNTKPPNLTYGLEDTPPFPVNVLLGFQHAALALVFIVYPLMRLAAALMGQYADSVTTGIYNGKQDISMHVDH